ncbi:hypothetical protein KVV02_003800 [Mortierella alpina]|uniref:Uncharacterized protein n=1 Tax=Mortierella alpina TaxID=64518 RepID=A0A9P8D300_MORAP|nr:hypothetical protein KVV02_003800 [Mortierella alpina]
MASTDFTAIPSSQPSCGDISIENPSPRCPSTTGTTNSTGPLACFIQTEGLFCAPISTTRGFIYTLDTAYISNEQQRQQQQQQQQLPGGALPALIPQLALAANNNASSPSPPLLGVDGQPVRYQGPARLGQPCSAIPLPSTSDPLFQTLVAMANQRLNEVAGQSPGVGAGEDIFNLRGDCEQGSYCDRVGASSSSSSAGSGICREQLPVFHNCTSYMQCISLRCDEQVSNKVLVLRARSHPQDRRGDPEQDSRIERRAKMGPTVCLPSRVEHGRNGSLVDSGTGAVGPGSGRSISQFQPWMGAVVGMVVILGAAFIFGLARRRKQLRNEKEKRMTRKVSRPIPGSGRDRERRASVSSSHSMQDIKDVETGQVNVDHALNREQSGHRQGLLGAWLRNVRSGGNAEGMPPETNPAETVTGPPCVHETRDLASGGDESPYILTEHGAYLDTGEGLQRISLDSTTVQMALQDQEASLSPTTTARPSAETWRSDTLIDHLSQRPSSPLSISIPRITATLSHEVSDPSTPLAGAGANRFDEGESHSSDPQLTPTRGERTVSSVSSSASTRPHSSMEESPPRSRQSSSNGFLTPSPTPNSPVASISPISPISPRPSLSSGSSSRLSHRQSVQAARRPDVGRPT